jgi:pimeloyl-ACP methyl ester carboxylesterase
MLRSREITLFSASLLALVGACSEDDEPTATGDAAVMGSSDSGGGGATGDADTETDAGAEGDDDWEDDATLSADVTLPIVFVHGFVGSASQFDSQFQRFNANGYPANRFRAYDHHGLVGDFQPGLIAMVDEVLAEFGAEKVFLVGHSRGTSTSDTYMMTPENAAKVAKYVSLDGRGCGVAMGVGIDCIAPSQMNQPGEKHVEVATSATSFKKMFEFFVGSAPEITEIVAQDGPVQISGRLVNFPENTGRSGTTLSLYEVNGDTGRRLSETVLDSFEIGDDGNWGPATVNADKRYELAVTSSTSPLVQHFYFQHFLRNTKFVRLLSGPPESASRTNTNVGDTHTAVTLLRMREWTPDDVINVTSTSQSGGDQPMVNAVTDMTGAGSIGFYIHDDAATPKMTTRALLPYFSTQPFQTGVDVYMPAADPVDGTITITNLPRGDADKAQTINVPNWPSSKHTVMAFFSDFPQD